MSPSAVVNSRLVESFAPTTASGGHDLPLSGPGRAAARWASCGLIAVLVLLTAAAGAALLINARATSAAERSAHVSALYQAVERALLVEDSAEHEFLYKRRPVERTAHSAAAAAVVEALREVRSAEEPVHQVDVEQLLAQHERYLGLTDRCSTGCRAQRARRGTASRTPAWSRSSARSRRRWRGTRRSTATGRAPISAS